MKNITPHLWFDTEAKEAAQFYASVLPNSKVDSVTTITNTPSGDADIVSFELWGQPFMAISAGPLFKFNPSKSFMIACETREEVDGFWEKLSEGGRTLMPLDSYPFSERFGWTEDRYGLSWQIMLSREEVTQRITPMLLFVGDVCGKSAKAIDKYTSVFPDSKVGEILRWGPGEEPEREGTVKYARFSLQGHEFAAMDSAMPGHDFSFNESISFMVKCDSQDEIDHYWTSLSAVPEAEQCGWLKDEFGVSWQIVPSAMDKMMQEGSQEQIARVTEAFLKMKKFDVAELQTAYEGRS